MTRDMSKYISKNKDWNNFRKILIYNIKKVIIKIIERLKPKLVICTGSKTNILPK